MTEVKIFGPPGTGKTTYLQKQVENAYEKFGDSIIATSFTKAAATELVRRDLPIPSDNVATLHALLFHSLSRPTLAETKVKEWNAEHPAYTIGEGASMDEPTLADMRGGDGDRLLAAYNRYRNMMIPREAWPDMHVAAFAREWEAWKAENDLVDFTGLLEVGLREVDYAPGKPAVGILDEAQDCTPLQLALWRKWARHMKWNIMAGDDDQCIYSFTGASPDAFLDPPVEDRFKRVLSQSYRVPRAIEAVASRFIAQVARREPKQYQPRDYDGEVKESQGNWKGPEETVEEAVRLVEQGKTVMLLAYCSFMLEPTIRVLRDGGIPYHNPYRRKRGDWNPLRPVKGVSASQRLLAFLKPALASEWWNLGEFQMMAEVLSADVFKHGRKAVIANARHGDLDWCLEHISERTDFNRMINGDLDWFSEHLLDSKRRAFEYPFALYRKSGAKALTEKPRIIVGTYHSVKGGQADHVFMVPDLSIAGVREYGMDPDPTTRTFYVGMTRAKEGLHICQPATPYFVGGLC